MCVMIINAVAIFSRNSRRDSWVVIFGMSDFGDGDGNWVVMLLVIMVIRVVGLVGSGDGWW